MKPCLTILFCTALTLAAWSAPVIGQPAPDFTLQSSDGASHRLSDFKGKYVVLEWVNYDCPFVVKHYSNGAMQQLQKDYAGKGVVWLSICSSAPGKQGHFTPEVISAKKRERNASPTAYLLDQDGKVGRAYEAKTTPHMFVINPEGNLIYAGAIDSIKSASSADIPKATNYVKAALDEAMAGKAVTTPSTPAYGCSVKY